MRLVKHCGDMEKVSREYAVQNVSAGFVPTMGSLHAGHLSLLERARRENELLIASIFVNPAQFGKGEDFETYPRDTAGDLEKLEGAGTDIVFLPGIRDIYPDGYRTYVSVEGYDDKMCGPYRPGHFRGVATVVAKLFNLVKPSRAYFGEKDYQQLQVIRAMSRDLNMNVEIVGCPTIREPDGLAMSSRNAYLGKEERETAATLYRSLKDTSERIRRGELKKDIAQALQPMLSAAPLISEIQYASAFDPNTLEEAETVQGREKILLALAVKIGATRLIDNMVIDL